MDMNLANKLTMLRVVMIPAFLLVLFLAPEPMNRYIAVIFIVASLTDMLDGKIARKYNMVSNFGKFMDPLADKLLVMSALVSMVALKDLAAWVVIVILAREFAITGFRTLAMEANIVMAEGENHHADDYDSCAAAESAVCVHACSGKASGDSGGILYDFLRRGLYH